MDNSSCSNQEVYSSPMPFIGLYVAGVSLVCFILMFLDFFFGLHRKIRYIPCRFFSLNSVTLTLLGVVSKLPIDLTTHKPSARDQLSKLTGTTMVCVCMGFLMPSIANNGKSEGITNVVALTILVVTIVVNICIQMSTGVIFAFKGEHITVMCFMCLLVFVMWFSTLDINRIKSILASKNKDLFGKGDKSFMYRVKRWYIYSCMYNPQLVACRDFFGLTIEVICIICSLVLFQAAFRSLVLKNMTFCEGTSDYKWSVSMIIVTQIGAVFVGFLTIVFRLFALVRHYNYTVGNFMEFEYNKFHIQFSFMKNRSIRTSIMILSQLALKFGLTLIFALIFLSIALIPVFAFGKLIRVLKPLFLLCKTRDDASIDSWIEEFGDMGFGKKEKLLQWLMKICVKDMNEWSNAKRGSHSYVLELLSRFHPSSQSTLLSKYQDLGKNYSEEHKVSCLSMVLLVQVTATSTSSGLVEHLRNTLDEAFRTIYFIDEKINVGKQEDSRRRELAKLLWSGGNIDLSKKVSTHSNISLVESAISNLEISCQIFPDELARTEMKIIRDFMKDGAHTTIDELCNYVDELFVDMLHYFLTQLPNSVFKDIKEGPIETCEETARVIVKFLAELEPSLENEVEWKFPEGTNITCLFDFEGLNANV